MKIFGIGLQKTGTTTLAVCLHKLGYRHMSYNHKAIFALRDNRMDALRAITQKFDSFDDEPWAHSYRSLYEWYPDGLFILTKRKSSEAWYNTFCTHCRRIPHNDHRSYFFGYEQPFDHKESYIDAYEKHNAEVLEFFKDKPEQLLVLCWENGDGWKELCSFIGAPMPSGPLPHANKKPPLNLGILPDAYRYCRWKYRQAIRKLGLMQKPSI